MTEQERASEQARASRQVQAGKVDKTKGAIANRQAPISDGRVQQKYEESGERASELRAACEQTINEQRKETRVAIRFCCIYFRGLFDLLWVLGAQ
jgi:hypothetical protein